MNYREISRTLQDDGYSIEDIDAAIDSLIDAGIEHAGEEELHLTDEELQSLRYQLAACASRANMVSPISQPGQIAQIYDYQTCTRHEVEIVSAERIAEFATLLRVRGEWSASMPVIVHADNTVYTPDDWQANYDDVAVADIHWVDWAGTPAIMLDGLPRSLR